MSFNIFGRRLFTRGSTRPGRREKRCQVSFLAFASFDLGYFRGSQLSSETVLADSSGVATAEFTAGGGTVDDIKILAAGPLTSGQVQFTVQVILSDP